MSDDLTSVMFEAVESELKRQIARLDQAHTYGFHEMLTYHMGWSGPAAGPGATGKRIRPLLLLLVHASAGGEWPKALPAAAAIELVHNFSLVHDDIQDRSDLRRGRETVWKIWGIAQGLNAGDGLFVLANLALSDLASDFPADQILRVGRILQETCLDLTRGQFLDLSYEERADLTVEHYWLMVAGKTAALISACAAIGAILAGADEERCEIYQEYAHALGMAFQVQDDLLGIWGEPALTGKSTHSDLVTGKKSLPVLFGLEQDGVFARRWRQGAIRAEEVAVLAEALEREGARVRAQQMADQFTDMALNALRMADPQGEAGDRLHALTMSLLRREA